MPTGPTGRRPIDERIHGVLAGRADPRDADAVRRWREASPENERSFQICARIFQMERTAGEATEVRVPPETRGVVWLAEARETTRKLTARTPTRAGREWGHVAVGMAAVFVIVVSGVLLHRAVTPEDAGLQVSMFLTGEADPLTMKLTDGSIVRLAPGSQMRVLPGSRARMVDLDGRAYFAVAHDAARPFVVRTRAGDVEVLGTRFQAEAAGDSMRVVVIEGQVVLSGIARDAKIGAAQVGAIKGGRIEPVSAVANIGAMLDWMGNFIAFQATPLETAMTEIAERHQVRYEIVDTSYTRRDLTMWFADQPLDEIVDVICAVLDAQCSIEADLIRIGE